MRKFTPFHMRNDNIAILILAAGASNRIGQPKQLLTYKNGTFISNITKEAIKSKMGDVFIVYGAYRHQIESELRPFARKAKSFYNDNWERGMGNSLAKGITEISQHGNYDAAIILLADQVMVDANCIRRLVELHQKTGKGLIPSYYAESYGPPTLFSSDYFETLKELDGDVGAKFLFKQNVSDLAAFYYPPAKIDIDHLDEYYELVKCEMI